MSTKKEEQNYGVTPINEGVDYIHATDRFAERQTIEEVSDNRDFLNSIGHIKCMVTDSVCEKDIEDYSEKHLMKTDTDAYNLRYANLTFCPGKLDNHIVKRDYDHILITGRTGSGKTHLTLNIINQLVLRYAPWQVRLNVWDGKGVDFIGTSGGPEFTDIHGICALSTESSLLHYLENRAANIRAMIEMFEKYDCNNYIEYNEKVLKDEDRFLVPQVILFEEFSVGLETREDVRARVFELLGEILKDGKRCGVYVILAMQPSDWVSTIYGSYFDKGGYVLATRLDEKFSEDLFGSDVATEKHVGKYGKVVMRDTNKDVILIDAVIYVDNKLKSICSGDILPMGQKFSDHKLNQLYRMVFGVNGKKFK